MLPSQLPPGTTLESFDEQMGKKPRKLKHLSPSGISTYRKDPEEFYKRYLATHAQGYDPQTQPMSIGSAFDAYAKSYLHEKLFGKGVDPKYEFHALFETQVEPQWRDWAKLHGLNVFDEYTKSGALADLLLELTQSINEPVFEIEIMGIVNAQREGKTVVKDNVILLGRPDVLFINKFGAHVVIDWKVNGYCSAKPVSPMKGYVKLRLDPRKGGAHNEVIPQIHHGVLINNRYSLHELNTDWATQLSVYSWLGGCQIGDQFIAGIDQICCSPNGSEFPDIRIAEHRMKVSASFQHETFKLAQDVWERSFSDHFFREMTLEQSQARCQLLNDQALKMLDLKEENPMFFDMTSPKKSWK